MLCAAADDRWIGGDLLDEVADFLHERFRLAFRGGRKTLLRMKIEERVTALGLPDGDAYLQILRREAAEERTFLDLITTNETYFFRNGDQFAYLREEILPEIEEDRNRKVTDSWGAANPVPPSSLMKMRILCAGCSTGEEPYSVAMTVFEYLRYPRAWDIRVTAGDISTACLRTAEKAVYPAERMGMVPDLYRQKYFEKTEGGHRIVSDVRRSVHFRPLNLAELMQGGDCLPCDDPEGFDIIFCRNVMIYFSSPAQQELVDALYRSLKPGGYLFTGDGEPLHLFRHQFLPARRGTAFIYRKGTDPNV